MNLRQRVLFGKVPDQTHPHTVEDPLSKVAMNAWYRILHVITIQPTINVAVNCYGPPSVTRTLRHVQPTWFLMEIMYGTNTVDL